VFGRHSKGFVQIQGHFAIHSNGAGFVEVWLLRVPGSFGTGNLCRDERRKDKKCQKSEI
jgi:hypothetical protein